MIVNIKKTIGGARRNIYEKLKQAKVIHKHW